MLPLPPPPLTLGFVRKTKILVETSRAKAARIGSQMRDLERLYKCERERGTIAHLRGATAPVRKMPVELLAAIFCYTWVFDPSYRFDNTVVKQVLALSHVCAHWRQVAITTPRLWTDVLPIKLNKAPTETYCAGLKEWLARSAPFPIPVQLECAIGVNADAVVRALLTVAHRWSDTSFALPSLTAFSDIPSDGLKELRKLTLLSSDTDYGALAAFSLARNLTEVVLVDTPHIARFAMPWTQLVSLRVFANSPQDCLDTLLHCPNLATAEFRMPAWPGHPDVSELKPITLGRLEVLDVLTTSNGSTTPFFACLALPVLRNLTLSVSTWATSEFTQFQLRSPNIETLVIIDSDLGSDDLQAVLRHAPAILELTLRDCRFALDIFIVTALSSSHQVAAQLAPRLHTLSMVRSCDSLDEDTVDALIAARWWADEQLSAFPSPPEVSRWASISIDRDEDVRFSPELEAKLDEYRRQGLSLNVKYHRY